MLEIAPETARVPDAAEVGRALGSTTEEVAESFRELGEAHVYVLEPNDPGRC